MALCGFNQKMLKGLQLFAEGIFAEAKIAGKNFDKVYNSKINSRNAFFKEIDDRYYKHFRPAFGSVEGIKKWVKEIKKDERFNQRTLKGLTLFAQGLYKQAAIRVKKDGVSFKQAYDNEIREMSNLLKELS